MERVGAIVNACGVACLVSVFDAHDSTQSL